MKRYMLVAGMLALGAVVWVGLTSSIRAAANSDYSGVPPFVSSVVTPNILLIMDNSASMALRASCQADNTGAKASGCGFDASTAATIAASKKNLFFADPANRPAPDTGVAYTGMFDPRKCYAYNTTDTRFEPVAGVKATFVSPCGSEEWDGHLLNWIAFRRLEALKKAMTGGNCVGGRAPDGSCPPTGTQPLSTIKGQDVFAGSFGRDVSTAIVKRANNGAGQGDGGYTGRVPGSVLSALNTTSGEDLFFHVIGTGSLAGSFCVDEDPNADIQDIASGSCQDGTDGSSHQEQRFVIHVALNTQPTGAIQDLGDKARFGLLEFRTSGDGGRVLTPIGSELSIPVDAGGGTPATLFNNNKAAMLTSIDGTAPATGTPLAETLLSGIEYIAQLRQPFSNTQYQYPIAFSPDGVAFRTVGIGSIGTAEVRGLTGSEPCPAGYQGSDASNCTAGRDPFFFSSTHAPAWATPSSIIPCCKTFILLLTDGEPTTDNASPSGLFDTDVVHNAALPHGVHCTRNVVPFVIADIILNPNPALTRLVDPSKCYDGTLTSTTVPPPAGTISPKQEAAILLSQHKVDYPSGFINHAVDDVAYWGHTNDLRQATVPVLNVAGHDLPGIQNVTVYTFFAFGGIAGREILMQTAKQGGFEDANANNIPDLASEYDKVDNLSGVLVPDGLPDTFFEAKDTNDIKDKLLAAITSILQKAASGTSVSVLATSSTGEGAIYQAYFFPSTFNTVGSVTTEVKWTGFTQGLYIDTFGNLREDYSAVGCTGPPDGKLVLAQDCIVKIRFDAGSNQVKVDRFLDSNGDGIADDRIADGVISDGFTDTNGDGFVNSLQSPCNPTTAPPCPVGTPLDAPSDAVASVFLTSGSVSNIQPLWEGGRRLALTDPGADCPPDSGGVACRRILAWVDVNNDGINNGEVFEFKSAPGFDIGYCPYLGGVAVAHCTSSDPGIINAGDITTDPTLVGCAGKTRASCAVDEARGIINFVRGCDPGDTTLAYCTNLTGLRSRRLNLRDDGGGIVTKTWKLGDIIHSTPVVVGSPRERFDVIYGDEGYSRYFQRYKDRRQVAYVGANDGKLHAFNAGFFSLGDVLSTPEKEQLRFTLLPNQPGTITPCSALPCDAGVATYDIRTNSAALLLGSEMWAFIPQDLLPQLVYLTTGGYDHSYYVDLKPKVTDARIFIDDADHPGGWGTILIGGFRLGGSCTNCLQGKAKPRVVNGDFNYDGDITDTAGSGADTRVFLSSYFVMDVTNPEKDPVLLWTFRDKDLGLTTAEPTVVRVSPSKTDIANERWYVVFGTGPTHHDAEKNNPDQLAQMYVVDLRTGANYSAVNQTSGVVTGTTCSVTSPCIVATRDSQFRAFSTGQPGFMGDGVALDFNLNFVVDAAYAGSVQCKYAAPGSPPLPPSCDGSNPKWKGAMHRLTTNQSTNLDNWGNSTGCPAAATVPCPSNLLSTFAYTTSQATTCPSASPCNVGPVTSKAALTSDDDQNIWVFFGTGRFFSNNDKTNPDIQHYFGVKDSFLTGTGGGQTVERNNLFNSSSIVVCTVCNPASPGNVSINGDTSAAGFSISFDTGPTSLLNQLQSMDGWFTTLPGARERNLSQGTLIGGTLFFTTFEPVNDICVAAGNGFLYALYFQTGGPYTDSAIGTTTTGGVTTVSRSISLGSGLPSQMAVQLGSEGTGASGSVSGSGCSGRITGFIQASTGVLGQTCGSAAQQFWSRLLSWRDL